jgi:hypothetical protein
MKGFADMYPGWHIAHGGDIADMSEQNTEYQNICLVLKKGDCLASNIHHVTEPSSLVPLSKVG